MRDESDEPLEERIVRALEDPDFEREELRSRPESAAEIERLRSVAGRLDQAAEEQEAVLELARSERSGAAEERFESWRAGVVGSAARRPRTRRAALWLGAAAAVLVIGVSIWRSTGSEQALPGGGDTPIYLGPEDGLHLVTPLGVVAEFDRFEFRDPRELPVRYRVEVYDASDPTRDPIGRSPLLREGPWEPTPEEREGWPKEILWNVTPFDGGGVALPSSEFGRASKR